MELTPAQSIIARDNHRFKVLNCGRRFGKTTYAVEEIKGYVAKGAKKIAYIATTYQQARDIVWNMLKLEMRDATFNNSILEVRFNDCTIALRGWENIETLRGQAFDYIVLDEVASMRNFWENWMEVIRPTLTDRKGEVLFISTPKGFNHFYQLYRMQDVGLNGGPGDLDYKSFHFTSYDNPYLPVLEIDKAKAELTEDRFAQEYLADFRKTEGLVYKEFSRDTHLYDDSFKKDEIVERIAGLDFGFTAPCALLTILKDYSGHYWVEDEWYKSGQTESLIAEYVSALRFDKVYPDCENPSAIKELRNKLVNVREVVKNKDSIVAGISKIRELLKQNKLHIHRRCVNTIIEFETYSYPDKVDMANPKELPIKENDHAMDALRYAIYMQPIEGMSNRPKQYIPKNLDRQVSYKSNIFKY